MFWLPRDTCKPPSTEPSELLAATVIVYWENVELEVDSVVVVVVELEVVLVAVEMEVVVVVVVVCCPIVNAYSF